MQEKTNRHPVDELADLRADIKRLEDRADTLRRMILDGKCGLVGADHYASIRTTQRESLDAKSLRREFGEEALRRFTVTRVSEVVSVNKRPADIDIEGEL